MRKSQKTQTPVLTAAQIQNASVESLNFIAGLNLTSSSFTSAEIKNAETLIQQVIQNFDPTLNLSKISTLYDLSTRQQAIIYLLNQAMSLALQNTMSLEGVINNPSLMSDAVVDAILSNIGITRNQGSAATGLVQVNVSVSTSYIITTAMTFTTVDGLVFNSTANYKATSNPVNPGDIQLYSTDSTNTQFYFLVPVTAVVAGVASQINNGTALTPGSTIPSFISAFSFGNFQGGMDAQNNASLVASIPEGQSAKNQVSRTSISAVLKNQFPNILSVSVQGMNDPAMSRNADNILLFKMGGYADIYVRTSCSIRSDNITKTATLVDIDGTTNNATYMVTLDPADIPGNYFVQSIGPAIGNLYGTYSILSENKSFNNQNFNPVTGLYVTPNKITTNQEGAYTAYQTNQISFQIDYDSTLGTIPSVQFPSTIPVSVQAAYQPMIADIQKFLNNPLTGVVLSDYLVRAFIPCLVELSQLNVTAISDIDPSVIQMAVFNYINGLQPGSSVRIDEIISLIMAISGVSSVDLPIQITGNIYAPNGQVLVLTSYGALKIPCQPALQVTPETCAFFVELSAIPVAIITK